MVSMEAPVTPAPIRKERASAKLELVLLEIDEPAFRLKMKSNFAGWDDVSGKPRCHNAEERTMPTGKDAVIVSRKALTNGFEQE